MGDYFDNKDLFVAPKINQYGGHMVMTNVIKERKKKYINIDTRFRDDYSAGASSNGNGYISITLPERITEVKKIELKCAEIPMSIFNISSDIGNNIFKIGNSDKKFPNKNYTTSELITAINGQLNTPTFSVAATNNICTFSSTTGATTVQFAIDQSGNFDKYNLKSKLGWALGFREPSITIPASGSISGAGFIDLNGPRYLYLVIDEFNQGNSHSFLAPLPKSFINKNIIARIATNFVDFPYGSVLTANVKNGLLVSDTREFTGKINLQKLNVQLVNEYGYPVNLNGLDFSFCIEVEHE